MSRILVALVFLIALTGCSGDESTAVTMTAGKTFEPDEKRVKVGGTVTWENDSSESHTVTVYDDELPSDADYFASGGASSEDEARDDLAEGLIDQGETFEMTFEEPGTYTYFCIPHESQGMVATIVVEE
jgi:plastocyanin